MQSAPPFSKPTVGRTFIVAISLLGIVAVAEFFAVGRAFYLRTESARQAEEEKLEMTDSFAQGSGGQPAEMPGPTPIPPSQPAPPVRRPSATEARIAELIEMAKDLRERGDTGTALTRLREAMAMAPNDPRIISEMAMIYEKMGLPDKALDQWKQVYDMGEGAGIYYTAAESKLKGGGAAAGEEPGRREAYGIQSGSVLGLLDITAEARPDAQGGEAVTLKVPVKARPDNPVEVRDVIIQVYFYDLIDGRNIVQTNANVSSQWTTLPADWADNEVEILQVDYSRPLPDPKIKNIEERKYFGYVVRVYYKNELQDMRAEPVKLLKQFPPPLTLTDGAK
jgi:hypothetical protein